MPELTEQDANNLAIEYYRKKYGALGVAKLLLILAKVDISGLIIFAFNRGVKGSEAER